MPLYTKRWDDPIDPADGTRILICRYRPRGLKKEFESWTLWYKELAPSAALLSAYHGNKGAKINWEIYRRRYVQEMRAPESKARIRELGDRLKSGESLTLLCSSACTRASHCHRTLLAELIEQAITE